MHLKIDASGSHRPDASGLREPLRLQITLQTSQPSQQLPLLVLSDCKGMVGEGKDV